MKVCQIKDICIGEGKPKVCLPVVVGVNEGNSSTNRIF